MDQLNLKKAIFAETVKIHDLVDLPIYSKINEGRKADEGLEMVPRGIINAMGYYGFPEIKAIRYKRLLEPALVDSMWLVELPDYQKLSYTDVVEEFSFEGDAYLIVLQYSGNYSKVHDKNWMQGEPDIFKRKLVSGEKVNFSFADPHHPLSSKLLHRVCYCVKAANPVSATVIDYAGQVERIYEDVDLLSQSFVYCTEL